MEDVNFCCYEFGEFRLDARRRALSKNGENVPLSARNFDLLVFMVENSGRVLEHDELLDKVWAGTFVEQATLKKGISALRQILAEKPENEFIKTIPRRGYSFVSPVHVVPEEGEKLYVREIEQEIVVEEYEEIDEPDEFYSPPNVIDVTPSVKSLPAGKTKAAGFLRPAIFAGVAVVVLTAAFFGLKYYLARQVQPQFSVENVRITRITNTGKVLSGVTVSPDGSYVVYPTTENGGSALWVRQTSSNTAKRLTVPDNNLSFWGFVIAPDDGFVYYIVNKLNDPLKSGLFKVPLFGGEAQRIAENVGTLAISPDGRQIAIVRSGGTAAVSIIDTNGDNEHAVMSIPKDSRLWNIRWTPDGAALLCVIRQTVGEKSLYRVAEISPENGRENVILPAQERIVTGAEWMPDKSALLLVVRETNADIRQIWQYFPSSQEWKRVTNDNNSYKNVEVTRDGKNIVTSQYSRLAAVWVADANLSNQTGASKPEILDRDNFRQITDGISSYDKLGWLADGRLVYSTTENGKEKTFAANADGGIRPLTDGEDGIWIFPSVAGSGQSICFLSSRSGSRQVWRINGDGKNLTRLTESNSPVADARILRDDKTVVYQVQNNSDNYSLIKQTPDGQTTVLTGETTGNWAISPDEKLLAVEIADQETHKFRVELRSFDDGKTLKTFNFLTSRQLSFTPDGKNLAFDVLQGDTSQIMLQPLDGGEPRPLTNFQSEEIFSFDWTRDGSRLAVIRARQLTDAVLIKNDSQP